jgi:hypothetical protein
MYTADPDVTNTLYKVYYTVLVPLSISDDMQRTQRLLLATSQLDSRSRKACDAFPLRQRQGEIYLKAYLDISEKYNGGVIESEKEEVEKKFDALCTRIASVLGSPEGIVQRKADLRKWGERNDRRGFRLFRDLIDQERDFKAWRKAQVNLPWMWLILERIATAYGGCSASTCTDLHGDDLPIHPLYLE